MNEARRLRDIRMSLEQARPLGVNTPNLQTTVTVYADLPPDYGARELAVVADEERVLFGEGGTEISLILYSGSLDHKYYATIFWERSFGLNFPLRNEEEMAARAIALAPLARRGWV